MKRLATLMLCLALFGMTDAVAKWQFQKTIYRNKIVVPHGVVMAPDGKLWVCANVRSNDTLNGIVMASLAIIDVDGNLINKVQTITVGGVTDTLKSSNRGGRGISLAKNGDILYSAASFGYRVNSATQAGIAKFDGAMGSLTQMAATDGGDVLVAPVVNGPAIKLYTATFSYVGTVVDTTRQIARCLAVSADGNDIYLGSTTGAGVVRYHCDFGTLGPYTVKDTILKIATESMTWRNGNLWLGCRDTVKVDGVAKHLKSSWYEWNPATGRIMDSLRWNHDTTGLAAGAVTAGTVNCTPRGLAFSVTGDTAFALGSDANALQVFKMVPTSVEQLASGVPDGYTLSQNYPNPFNPSTEISFTLPKAGFATVKVYDILGKEVATLVEENLGVGTFKTTLDGSRFSSGTYIYSLTSGGTRISKKMMLLK
jgi:hypothetical protein